MTTALHDLDIVQLGTEDAWGCDAAPTVRLMGIDQYSITPIRSSQLVGDMRGSLAPGFQHVRTIEEGSASLGGLVCFEDIPYWFDALFGKATSATDANGTFTRSYSAPLVEFDSDLADASTFNIICGSVSGDSASDVASIVGATLSTFSIEMATAAPIRFSAQFMGKQVGDDALDASKADRTVEFAMGDDVSLWIDVDSDAVGTTAIDATAFRASLSVNPNRSLVRHLGSLTPDKYRDSKWSGTLNLSLELTSAVSSLLHEIIDGNVAEERVIRLKAAIGSGATARHIQIDFSGALLAAPNVFEYSDGLKVVNLVFTGVYNSTMGNWLNVAVLNDVETLA